ncbi:hypothetical protein HGRIS_004317 [Hohenbuehelia grisea]|uniref:Uncharacterized protein n=1 Tax=Hohenbuehelia grisea TaxID=104357 RepID=A0ABR3IPE4_9AGAR
MSRKTRIFRRSVIPTKLLKHLRVRVQFASARRSASPQEISRNHINTKRDSQPDDVNSDNVPPAHRSKTSHSARSRKAATHNGQRDNDVLQVINHSRDSDSAPAQQSSKPKTVHPSIASLAY